jgi:hypothetical protein
MPIKKIPELGVSLDYDLENLHKHITDRFYIWGLTV